MLVSNDGEKDNWNGSWVRVIRTRGNGKQWNNGESMGLELG